MATLKDNDRFAKDLRQQQKRVDNDPDGEHLLKATDLRQIYPAPIYVKSLPGDVRDLWLKIYGNYIFVFITFSNSTIIDSIIKKDLILDISEDSMTIDISEPKTYKLKYEK